MNAQQINALWERREKDKPFTAVEPKFDFRLWLIKLVVGRKRSVIMNLDVSVRPADGGFLFTVPEDCQDLDLFVSNCKLVRPEGQTIVLRKR